jgi:hypothetical protein
MQLRLAAKHGLRVILRPTAAQLAPGNISRLPAGPGTKLATGGPVI